MRHLIIGGGIAGTSAAEQLRKQDSRAKIALITEEPHPLYSRILLTEFIAGAMEEDRLFVRKPDWYRARDIELVTGVSVESIDAVLREVRASNGSTFAYDNLLLATGGISFVPPVPGIRVKGVFTLRSLSDARRIMEHTERFRNVVVLGGGVLGLEAGYSLLRAGCDVTVVEFFPRLLPRQMDVAGADLLQKNLEKQGFRFLLGARARDVIGNQRVEGIRMEDGTRIECNTLLVSAGVRPNRRLTDPLELPTDKGVQVNDRLETPRPGIYAAGDVIEHRGIYYGLWGAAQRQGEVAGINMGGGNETYTGTTVSNQLKVAGVDLLAAGEIDADNQFDSLVITDGQRGVYRKLVIRDGTVVGAILYGDLSDRGPIRDAIQKKTPVAELNELMTRWKNPGP